MKLNVSIKRMLIYLYVTFLLFIFASRTIDDFRGEGPLWYILLDFTLPCFIVVACLLYANKFRARRSPWIWRLGTSAFVLLGVYEMLYHAGYSQHEIGRPGIILILVWAVLFPGIFMAFRLGFPAKVSVTPGSETGVKDSTRFGRIAEIIVVCLVASVVTLGFFFQENSNISEEVAESLVFVNLRKTFAAQDAYYQEKHRYARMFEDLIGSPAGMYLSDSVVVHVLSAGKDYYELIAYHIEGPYAYFVAGPGASYNDYEIISKAKAAEMVERSKKSLLAERKKAFQNLIQRLINDLEHEDEYFSKNAVIKLESMTGKEFGHHKKQWQEWWEQNREVFAKSIE